MTDKYIKMKVSDLRELVLYLWGVYINEDQDDILTLPLKLGLMEERTLTKADLENNTFRGIIDEFDLEVGDWYYYILSEDEICKKLEANNDK